MCVYIYIYVYVMYIYVYVYIRRANGIYIYIYKYIGWHIYNSTKNLFNLCIYIKKLQIAAYGQFILVFNLFSSYPIQCNDNRYT